jgi:tyrosine-specific transport protein
LIYGEVVLRTNGRHRLIGYAGIYLGKWGKIICSFSAITGAYAALLAYLILGGNFLFILLGNVFGGTVFAYSAILFLVSAIFIAKGLKMVSALELFLSFIMLFALLFFIFRGSFLVNPDNFSFAVNWPEAFLPYGVILFSLAGASIIPDIVGVLDRSESRLKKAIIWGTLIPAIVYFFFIAVVFGISGSATTEDAISGLSGFYRNEFIILGALVGFLAVFTSFLAYGTNLRKTFQYDYNFSKPVSLTLALLAPFLLLAAGTDSFIRVIGFAGAVMGGVDGILLILMYQKADRGGKGDRKPEYDVITSKRLEYLIIFIFILGIIYTILNP